jgi:hypothetical protein
LLRGGTLEITVEDRAAQNDAQREHDELDWDHLRGIETLQGFVHVANLHDSCAE